MRQVSKYVFKILKVFGVYDEEVVPAVDGTTEGAGQSYEESITPLMNVLSKFRDQIKEKAGEGTSSLFRLCDELRDDILPYLGVRLEDRAKGQEAIWKYEDKEALIKERESKIREKEKKEEEKRKRKEDEIKKRSTPATEWFKVFRAAEFTQFDDTGLPTHGPLDKEGKAKELSESVRNKLKKEWNKQNEVYQKYMLETAAGVGAAAAEDGKKVE